MDEINSLISNIRRGKDLEHGLAGYGNQMLNYAHRLSELQFVMNYATFYDSLYDWKQSGQAKLLAEKSGEAAPLGDEIRQLNRILEMYLLEEKSSEELIDAVDGLRKRVTELVSCLSALSDRYTIFEYIMNRKEATFTGAGLPENYSDQALTDQLASWLSSDREMVNLRLVQMVEQLPIRMTKSRFFQILENGLGVYADAERKTLDNAMEMLRSSALLTEPDSVAANFPWLHGQISGLEETDYDEMTPADFRKREEAMRACGEELDNVMSAMLMLADLVNRLYVQILSSSYAMSDVTEREAVREILEEILELFKEEIPKPISENLYEKFTVLEGKQEALLDSFETGISALDDIRNMRQHQIQEQGLQEEYDCLVKTSRLLSDSLFGELREENQDGQICGKEYVRDAFLKLQAELTELFQGMPRYRVRALMAKILTFLPPFLQTQEEIRKYIFDSLCACKDPAEKAGCVEILMSLLVDD